MTDVVVVEDHTLVAETLRAALRQQALVVEVVTPLTTAQIVRDVLAHLPRLVLLDLDLGGPAADAVDVTRRLAETGVRCLLVSGSVDLVAVAEVLEAGAVGYVSKAVGFDTLLERCVAALDSTGVLDPASRGELLEQLARHRVRHRREREPFDALTDREKTTLRLLGDGHTVQVIARRWTVSEATVRSHVRGVLSKLGESSQLAAVARAHRTGWMGPAEPR